MGIWDRLDAYPDRSALQNKVHGRALWHKTSVQQLSCALRATEWVATEGFMASIVDRSRLMLSTLPVEELIGAQKNDKACKVGRRFRKPEYSMSAAIRAGVLDARSKFVTPALDTALESKAERLSADVFFVDIKQRSLPFGRIQSTKGSPSFYSPAAMHLNTPYADLSLLRVQSDKFTLLPRVSLQTAFRCCLSLFGSRFSS